MSGLPGSLRALAATLLSLAGAQAGLVALELRGARERERRKLVLAAVAAVFLSVGALLSALVVVLAFWDTHRVLAAGAITLAYLAIGAAALWRLRELNRESMPLLAAGALLVAWLARR